MGFFGPKWWCWFLVLLGSIPWFIEGPFKVLGYGEFGPGYQTIQYITSVFIVVTIYIFSYFVSFFLYLQ